MKGLRGARRLALLVARDCAQFGVLPSVANHRNWGYGSHRCAGRLRASVGPPAPAAFIESWHLAANDVEFRSWTIRCFDLSEGEASFSYERHLLRGVRIGSMVAALY